MGNSFSWKQHAEENIAAARTCPSHLAPLRLVIISDTHNDHRALGPLPMGDVLIHAGDFTCYGRQEHVEDFNNWLGSQPHRHKIVVNGNHENNAPWQRNVRSLLSNAVFLKDEAVRIPRVPLDSTPSSLEEEDEGEAVTIFGTDFFWPMKAGHSNPNYEQIPSEAQVVVTHGPVKGYVDGGSGCPAMLAKCEALGVSEGGRLQLVVSGHVHSAYGVVQGTAGARGIQFVNASNVGGKNGSRKIANPPIVIDI